MTDYDDALDLPRDDNGRVVGYLVGKAAKLADWSAKKEEAQYTKLFERLYKRNWARRERQRSPEKVRERQRRWRAANREHYLKLNRDRKRRIAAAQRKRCTCKQCGAVWTPQRRSSFCSLKCRNRWHGKRRVRNRGLRNMKLRREILDTLRAEPWLTLPEIKSRLLHASYGSIATKLSRWAQSGELIHDGRQMRRRYALPGRVPP